MEKQLLEEKKQKLRIILPVLIIPFLFLSFFMLGGGKGSANVQDSRRNALSFTLPDPLIDNKPTDKLSIYQQADKDSIARLREAQLDPFAQWMPKQDSPVPLTDTESSFSEISPYIYTAPMLTGKSTQTPISKRKTPEDIERKLAELEKLMQQPDTSSIIHEQPLPVDDNDQADMGMQHLENMMQSISSGQDMQQDAVLTQADNVLEKILDVQHPSRVTDRLKQQSEQNKGKVYAVSTEPEKEVTDLLTSTLHTAYYKARFYDDEEYQEEASQNALSAVVHENQTLVSGATVKLRLEQNAYVQGQLIPKGSFIYGKCSLNGERLLVSISSIRYGNSIFPVSLVAYDMDGIAGLRIPGSINRDATREGTEQMVQALSLGSLNPSLGAQATSAGLDIAKNLLTRKVKLVRISVKAGYPMLLASSTGI
ncbi:MAG: conjugative transposon protein TraM [Chitinophagaceae bacterium]|nr:conjugative transposon protein TraM [Chitinophagaceae bacterium]